MRLGGPELQQPAGAVRAPNVTERVSWHKGQVHSRRIKRLKRPAGLIERVKELIVRLTKEREADIRDILDRDGNIGFHMTNDLLSEIDALRAELDEWKELHKRHVAMVIPGETDSADAYRKMYFQLRAALEEIAKYDAPAEDSVYTKVWMRLGKIAADALKR